MGDRPQAKFDICRWIVFDNNLRPHAAHGGQPPTDVYFNQIETGQQGHRVAEITAKTVQGSGRSSLHQLPPWPRNELTWEP